MPPKGTTYAQTATNPHQYTVLSFEMSEYSLGQLHAYRKTSYKNGLICCINRLFFSKLRYGTGL